MTRLPLIDTDAATGKVAEMLQEYEDRTGVPPGPMVRGLAGSSAMLRGYLDLNRAMKRAHLDRRVSEQVSLAVQAWIGCDYCIEAHTRMGRQAGLGDRDVQLALQGTAADPKVAALVAFAQQVVGAPAEIGDADVDGLRALGWRDEQIADVVGLAALNLLTGAFNLVAGIEPATAATG
jgi:uncharacterized peroxidase-related enzyme